MTKFEDQLYEQLMTEHGHHLHAAPAPARRRVRRLRLVRRPVWLATGLAGVAAAATATVMALGSAPAMAAYTVTQHHGTVSVSVRNSTGVTGANTTLHRLGAHVVVVPTGPSCTPISSLPHPEPAPHPSVLVKTGEDGNGHRSVSVQIGGGGIPAGDTMILAFSAIPGGGSLGAGGIITGPVPSCVSLPSAPPPGASG